MFVIFSLISFPDFLYFILFSFTLLNIFYNDSVAKHQDQAGKSKVLTTALFLYTVHCKAGFMPCGAELISRHSGRHVSTRMGQNITRSCCPPADR